MILVVDIPTNRIIYYTPDTTESLVLARSTVIVRYYGAWPAEITPTTCWNWVYLDGEIRHALTYKNQEGLSVMEINRAAFRDDLTARTVKAMADYPNIDLLKCINDEINKYGNDGPLIASLAKSTGDSTENIVAHYNDLYSAYIDKLRSVEYVRSRFDLAYSLCKSNSELIFIKGVVESSKMSPKFVDSKDRVLTSIIAEAVDVSTIKSEIDALGDVWSDKQIDSQQEAKIIQVIKAAPLDGKTYPENIWNSLNVERTSIADLLPATMQYLEGFAYSRGESLCRVSITLLSENEEVPWSIDIGDYYQGKKRFHLCVSGQYEMTILNQSTLIEPGTLLMINNKLPHMLQHFGSDNRIAIVFDTEKK